MRCQYITELNKDGSLKIQCKKEAVCDICQYCQSHSLEHVALKRDQYLSVNQIKYRVGEYVAYAREKALERGETVRF